MNFGERIANRQLQKVGRKLRASYRTAQKELEETLADFNKRFKEKDRQKRALKAAGKISEQEYKNWLSGQVFIRGQWEKKLKSVCRVLHEYNVQAGKMIHEGKIDVFAENYNYSAFVAEQKTGISFDIYNTEAVTRLIKDEPQVLPEWKVDEEKDYKWNRKKVQNAVTQGIIQGDSIEDITARLCRDLVTTNENKMRLFARTAMTGAQNAGRQKHMEQAAKKGIRQNKRWVATLDSRTRDAHRELDGQEVPYDKPFKIDGEEIMFPGDPSAPPALSYNCRCRHVTIYPDYEDYSKRDWREDEIIDGQSYEEWKKGKKAKKQQSNNQSITESTNAPIVENRDGKYYIVSDAPEGIIMVGTEGVLDKTVEKIEFGELFNETQVIETAKTLDKLQNEYPLDKPLQFVGDMRIDQNLPHDIDILDLQYEYPKYSGFAARYVATEDGTGKIWIASESLNTESLENEFDLRHQLRKKYMDANGMLSEKNAFDLVSDTIEGTIFHEYCHVLQDRYLSAAKGSSNDVLTDCFNELYMYLNSNKEKVLQISSYATKHPFEMLSEAFVQMRDTKHEDTIAVRTAKEIWNIFEKYTKKR